MIFHQLSNHVQQRQKNVQQERISQLEVELEDARARGKANEVQDLLFLLNIRKEPPAEMHPNLAREVKAAENRRAQRKYRHANGIGVSAVYRTGDNVLCPDGMPRRVLGVDNYGRGQVLRLEGHYTLGARQARLLAPVPSVPLAVADALYHAAADALERENWEILAQALDAYVAALGPSGTGV